MGASSRESSFGALALVLALAGCGDQDSQSDASGIHVVESEDLGADWACTSPDACRADYDAFIDRAMEHAVVQSSAEVDASVQAIADGKVPLVDSPLDSTALADAIWNGLGVKFLSHDLDGRLLEAVTRAKSSSADYDETDLLLIDPWVGTFRAILLMPKGKGPFPAVLALHGHPESGEIFRDQHHGAEFPSRGYAILMPTFRVMAIDPVEHDVSWKLLENGFSLMGLRVYEALLGLKYLRHHPDIDHDRIALIGHSGGASTGNLVVRLEPRFRAYVSDNAVDWFSSGQGELPHCETVPELHPYHAQINQFSSCATPIKNVIYDYLGAFPGIFDWFDEQLAP